MHTSLEVEYWVIDSDGRLTSPGSLADEMYTEREFVEPLFELKTPPCASIDELRRVFVGRLEAVLSKADDLGKGLVPLGTPVNTDSIERWPDERARVQEAVIGADFEYTKHCAGTHIHFEKRNVTDQLNALIGLDAALALVNSSPYLGGERVANSARAYCYRKRAYRSYPKHGQLWHYVESVGEWHRRLERRYEEFVSAALEDGIDESTVEANFSPDDVVWTPVRLRDQMPTVEWRSPDTALPSQLLQLAGELTSILDSVHHRNVRIEAESAIDHTGAVSETELVLPEFETACDLAEAAIDDGLESGAVAHYLDRMGFSVADYHPLSMQIGGRQYVPKVDARELRLEYADVLEDDVDALARSLE